MLQEMFKPYLPLVTDGTADPAIERLSGDGSSRAFYRLSGPKGSLIGVLPEAGNPDSLRESRAYWDIGKHLASRSVPVPTLYGYEATTGSIIMEDLGDVHLQHVVRDCRDDRETRAWYHQVLQILINMQVSGAQGFDAGYCFDTTKYDRKLMLERESAYFVHAFLQGCLQLDVQWEELGPEFERLADLASQQPATFFLHRDFQSRNIMVCDGRPRIIDFQGGRYGPLSYDLASLLFDPYVDLADSVKDDLFEDYASTLAGRNLIGDDFRTYFWYIALQRALQVLGAFGFLTTVKNKLFFKTYIPTAVKNVKSILDRDMFTPFRRLRQVVAGL